MSYDDEKYFAAKELVDKREGFIKEIRKISKEIERLTKLRQEIRQEARKLSSEKISQKLEVSQNWVERISECRVVRYK